MANITVTLYWDMDLRKWTTTLGGTTETDPIQGLVQGDIVKFAVRFVQTGVAVVLAAPVFTASGIKADNDFTGSYLIQLSAPVLSDTTLYTFTVNPLNSANLNTFLQTYRNTWCALEIYDSVNGILTTPLELQITPGYSLSGTPTDNVAGVIVVAATKTVTFPQSLTFPSALGTNGFQLTTDGAGTLTWAASGALTDGDKGDITVSNSGATFTIDNDVVGLAQLAHMPTARVIGRTTAGNGSPELLTISGTGSVAMTNTPTLVTPVLGAATATSINGITISAGGSGTLTMANSINTSNGGGSIDTSFSGGNIDTSGGGGDITTNGTGSIGLGETGTRTTLQGQASGTNKTLYLPNASGNVALTTDITGGTLLGSFTSIELGTTGTRTTFRGNAATTDKTIDLPNLTGTVVVTAATSATATQALFAQATGFPAYRAIATADIATALTTPGAIGGTTASTGAFTTVSLKGATSGVVTLAAPATATTATLTFAPSASVTMTPPATNFTAARTDAAQTLTATQTISDTTDRNGSGAGASLTVQATGSAGPAFRVASATSGVFSVFVHGTNTHSYMGTGGGSLIVTNGTNSSGSTLFSVTSGGAFSIPGTLAVTGTTTLGGGTAIAKLRHGSATLVAGTKTVTDTAITANSRIWINRFTDGGTLGDSYSITRSAGASFTITSKTANVTATLDTSVVSYLIIEP